MGSKKKEEKEKPLSKMTAKELRELAIEIPQISGVHGMNKDELVAEIKKARGIVEEEVKKSDSSVRELKTKMKAFRSKRELAIQESNLKMADVYRSRIVRLKKRTRRGA